MSSKSSRTPPDVRAYEAILSTISDFAYLFDLAGRFRFINKALLDLWGLTLDQAVGKNFFELNYPEPLAAKLQRQIQQVIETKARVVDETPYTNPAGQIGYYEYIFSPVLAADGTVEAVAGSTRDISERKRADEQARTILESITDAFFAVDRQWRFNYVNAQAERMLGRVPGDLIGKVIWDVYPGLIGSGFEQKYRRAMSEQVPGSITAFYPDHQRWYEAHVYPSADGISIYFRNATETKQAEAVTREVTEKLERQVRLFERIASSTLDFIYVFDLDGRFLYANRRLLEVWGTNYEQAIGKNLYELGYPKWHADMHVRELRQVIETKQPIRGEVPFTGGSGISGVYEYIFTPVLGPDGNVEVIAGTTRDVTDRQNAEQLMARDATLLANVQDSVIVTDLNGVVTFWNEGATRLFGWTADEMLNRPMGERLPASARAEVAGMIAQIAAGKLDFDGEWLDHRKDGSRVWIEVKTRLITDPSGKASGIMGVSRDISDRKRAEAERERLLASERAARGEAERASQMKDEFLATLSHELRTPLNAILGWATLLATGKPDEADLVEGLETIQRNARAQTQIIEDLLDMSRIISGKVRLDVQRTELSPVIRAAVETVKPAADARSVRIQTVLDPSAGAFNGDPNRLQQVFWNLLSNAVKFTPKGGLVQVVLARVNSHVEVSVADTGEGIRADFLPHVFDRFWQADASITRRHGGLGLGLAIVKQLVELHGGSVRAASDGPGKGTTFTVVLPLAVVHTDPERDPADRRHPTAAPPPVPNATEECPTLSGVRILVVDDEPDARALIKRVLDDCDAVVRTAASVTEAIALIDAERPDVLISDIGMPGEDGYSLIRRVRERSHTNARDLPAVALTAYARSEDRVRAIRAGYQSHVSKPVEPAELITVVASLARTVQGRR